MEQTVLSINDDKMTTRGELIEYPAELIGGRNLILKDEYLNRIGYSGIVFGNYTIEIPSSTNDLGVFIIQVKPNTTYTVSFKGEASSTRLFQYTSKPTDVLSGAGTSGFSSPHTFTTGQYIEYLGVGIYGQDNNSYPVKTYDWQLEKGNKATDWTPSPEDLGLSYPNWVTEFKPSISENGILAPEFDESGVLSFSINRTTAQEFIENPNL